MEQQPSPEQHPEDLWLENNPDLLELATRDQGLADQLDGLRRARALVVDQPDVAAIQALPSSMEQAIRERLDRAGYAWHEVRALSDER